MRWLPTTSTAIAVGIENIPVKIPGWALLLAIFSVGTQRGDKFVRISHYYSNRLLSRDLEREAGALLQRAWVHSHPTFPLRRLQALFQALYPTPACSLPAFGCHVAGQTTTAPVDIDQAAFTKGAF